MSKYHLGTGSREQLAGVHPVLVGIVERAIQITTQDFRVTEGRRTLKRQAELRAQGKSKTMASRHLTGHAVDLVPVKVPDVWNLKAPGVESAWLEVQKAMFAAAKEAGISLRWGGDFNGDGYKVGTDGWDLPHFELKRADFA